MMRSTKRRWRWQRFVRKGGCRGLRADLRFTRARFTHSPPRISKLSRIAPKQCASGSAETTQAEYVQQVEERFIGGSGFREADRSLEYPKRDHEGDRGRVRASSPRRTARGRYDSRPIRHSWTEKWPSIRI